MQQILSINDCHELVKRILSDSCYKLVGFSLKPLNVKSGLLGEHAILHVQLSCESEPTELKFFVKSLPNAASQRDFVSDSGAFFKEEKMFLEIVPHFISHGVRIITECMPKCFLARGSEVLVLEDLSEQGYKILNHRESYDLVKTKVGLDAIVKLHASGLILEEKLSKNRSEPYRLNTDFELEFEEAFYTLKETTRALQESAKKGVSTLIDLFPNYISALSKNDFKKLAHREIDNLREFSKPSRLFRNTICHGDLWATNIMFKFNDDGEPVHCCLIDFQSYRYSPPAQDVLAFIYLTTDRKFRDEHMEDVLLYYYNQLADALLNNGIKIEEVVPYEKFSESCDYYKSFAVTQKAIYAHIVMMTPEELVKFFSVPGYSKEIIFEDRSELILRLCESDSVYRKIQHESTLDLGEICEEIFRLNRSN